MSRSSMGRWSVVIGACSLVLMGADWTRFRGPGAQGTSDEPGVPVTWSEQENLAWKTPLPGFGSSSPITVGDKVFLTCYSGYGLSVEDPGQQEQLRYHLVCIRRSDGKILWDRATRARLPEQPYEAGFIKLHGYASATPATDGQMVYAFFGRSGVFAYSLDGQLRWQASVGDRTHNWGCGTSPILYRNLVIVNASVESQSLVALDKADGREVWRLGPIERSWSTPLVVDLPDGSQELVVSMQNKVLGIDPATGKELWHCDGIRDYVVPAVIAHQGIVYIAGGRKPQTLAIRAGGRGDVTQTHLLWQSKHSTKVPTPLYHQGYLYWIDQRGVAACLKADTGELVYQQRLTISGRGDKIYASLVLADGRLYGVTRQDGTIVLAAGPQFKELARNYLSDSSIFNATPVPDQGQLLVRSDRFLYCIGK